MTNEDDPTFAAHLKLARAQDEDYFYKKRKLFIQLGVYHLLYSKQAQTRRRRAFLLSEGLYSRKKRCLRAEIPTPEGSAWGEFIRRAPCAHPSEAWCDWVGLPELAFRDLVNSCEELWRTSPLLDSCGTPRPCDIKKRILDCTGAIGLLMFYVTHRGDESTFGKVFGLVDTEVQKYVEFGLQIALPVLRNNPYAKIHWPVNDIEYLNRMGEYMERYVPGFKDDFGRIPVGYLDAIRYHIVNKADRKARKQDQTEEKMTTLRKCQFIFDPMCRCVACVLNTPPWGDSKCCISGKLYKKIRQLPQGPPQGYCILTDTSYQGSLRNAPIIKILKVGQFIPADLTRDDVEELEKKIIRGRQPSEWGNNQMVQFIVRPRCTLSHDDVHNGCLLELGVLLHNYRVHYSDRNELKRFFKNLEAFGEDPSLDPDNIFSDLGVAATSNNNDDSSVNSNYESNSTRG